MKKILLNSALLIIAGVGLLAGRTMATPVPEPIIMLLFGTALVCIAGIVRKVTVKS